MGLFQIIRPGPSDAMGGSYDVIAEFETEGGLRYTRELPAPMKLLFIDGDGNGTEVFPE